MDHWLNKALTCAVAIVVFGIVEMPMGFVALTAALAGGLGKAEDLAATTASAARP